ncbi:BspA family leucine-rich repeat surface protein [Campylobacter sp. B0100352/1]|uniref:BspA family leucine-rich repeat surface protein n=1 Tax=Campylobacter sp. B0100352/1 TaxID=2735783 RepID=UPI001D73B676|nr:BspA family leucine-rich repeat surface protein [Campylobacter sp. B0100352/1]
MQNQLYCPMNNIELIFLVEYAQDKEDYLITKVALDCINLIYLNSLESAFMYRERFDGIESWDVSHIKNFSDCFYHCENMNVDLSKWDVRKGQDFHEMFSGCNNFNCDISSWNMGKVRDMDNMFCNCKEFNQNLDAWKISTEILRKNKNIFKGCLLEKNPPIWLKEFNEAINADTGILAVLNLIEDNRDKDHKEY